jgi:hypothetical protein
MAMAAACLTRYAGLAFAAPSVLLVLASGNWSHRAFLRSMLHGGISVSPLLTVMAWNHIVRGSATNRVFLFHPPRWSEFSDAGAMLASWMLPDRLWLAFPVLPWFFFALAIAGLCTVFVRVLFKRDHSAVFWWLPVIVYLVFLLISFTFFDSNISYDRRMLSPIVFFVVGGFCLHAIRSKGRQRMICLLLMGYLCLFGVWRAKGFAASRFLHGSGYYGEAWNSSALVARIEREKVRRIVYSNAEMGFATRGTEGIRGIVCTKSASSWQDIPHWEEDYKNMINHLKSGAILARVLLESVFWREEFVPLEQILHDAGLEKLAEYPDGTIWGIPSLKEEFCSTP